MFSRSMKSDETDLALIEAVRDHPDLYDKNSFSYNDLGEKEKIWMKIATKLGAEVNLCRQRWKNLRDTFVKSRKKPKWKRSGPGIVKSNTWKFAKEMEFLLPFIREYDYLLQNKEDGTVREEEDFQITTNVDNDVYIDDDVVCCSEDEAETNGLKRKHRLAKSGDSQSNEDMGQPEVAAPAVSDETEPRPKKMYRFLTCVHPQDRMDDVESFFYSMGQTVRKLPVHVQSHIKRSVCQIVTDAELQCNTSYTSMATYDSELVDVKPIAS